MIFLINRINVFLYKLIFYFILFYQRVISPLMPARCRYYPTCSNYGKNALAWHGVWMGSWLLLKRIGRCHPLGGHGIDFVPLPLGSYDYQYVSSAMVSIDYGRGVYLDNRNYVGRLNHVMKI